MEENKDIQWITVNGKHIPIKPGESKKDAISKAFSEDRDGWDDDDNEEEYNALMKKASEETARVNTGQQKEVKGQDYDIVKEDEDDKKDNDLYSEKSKLVKKYEDMGYANDDAILHAEKDMVAKYGEDWNSYLEKGEITEEEISEALADFAWQITDADTVDSYAQNVAEKLGIEKQKVLDVIMREAPNKITPDMKMAKVAGLDYEEDDGNKPEDNKNKAEPQQFENEDNFTKLEDTLKEKIGAYESSIKVSDFNPDTGYTRFNISGNIPPDMLRKILRESGITNFSNILTDSGWQIDLNLNKNPNFKFDKVSEEAKKSSGNEQIIPNPPKNNGFLQDIANKSGVKIEKKDGQLVISGNDGDIDQFMEYLYNYKQGK